MHSEGECSALSWWNVNEPNDSSGEDCAHLRASASSIDVLLNDNQCTWTGVDYFLCDAPTYLVNVEVNPTRTLFECEGDCDNDDQCAGNLVCFHNQAGETNVAPGCQGTASDNWDYCYDATNLYDVEVDPSYTLTECQGDCDDDSDCDGDLVCFFNSAGETNVPPGCQGPASDNWDYCYDSSSSGKSAPSLHDNFWRNPIDQMTKHVADGSEVIMLSMKDIVIIFLVLVNVITLIFLAVWCCRKCRRDVTYKPIEVESEMDDLL